MTNHLFQSLDEILAQHSVNPLTLNPHKTLITSFVELENLITAITTDQEIIVALRDSLELIIYAQVQNFPENIFWDFDFMVGSMVRQALVADEGAVSFLKSFGHKMVLLIELFGIKKEIRFRYVHDFIYGFDWARWVKKEPQSRSHSEPFSLVFLDNLLIKGEKLVKHINYGQVTSYNLGNTGYRNPFDFSREPEDEHLLLTSLAKEKLIPVEAWNWDISPVWNQPFQEMRQQLALKLNIQPQKHS
ncbi:hypothetical protein PN465_18345 [Nodularia spumigena CS-584]|jgi:hypothetical protein|uniref:Ferrochelatase n=2 Tax=Nodularia spumigena TaxID=70799 RepID=A0A2S0Q7D3_NODSP|nr:hypothetical protein [Nodularia spumigena]AHJ30754.1 hypothetical protein NSP_44570 [Nodularia spumigena CCY9414]AVZ30277.1 hypothetical protein BMF81_01643 [Nodularia spumigena UHCC 0039]EAW44201.1 hypothetical protein N9414_07424 [Nodularia spumigena CCY9414]MDB9384157.1 hypothetical protein [Nodularia spumigena CS-584]MEA5525237.1 hypothetical protein [Nodularia spumigena UHCC 0143]